jgi:hypothetical protein
MYGGMLLGVRNLQVVTLGSCGHSLIDCVFFAKIYFTQVAAQTGTFARGGGGGGAVHFI